jgi:hypothetical protein
MNVFTGSAVAAALLFTVTAANAQMAPPNGVRAPYTAVSDFGGPYAAMPPDVPAPPPYDAPPRYGYGPSLLPPTEVYTVLRENGFSPLGIPRLRGNVYTIAAIDRRGDDGRLVIDARSGRIIRFVPAYGIGPASDEDMAAPSGPRSALPPPTIVRGVPRPPAPVPHVASRSVPVPKPSPLAAKPAPAAAAAVAIAPAPAPAQQAAIVPVKPAETPAAPPVAAAAAPAVGEAKPSAPAISPTQEMPKVQGLE